MSLTIEINDNRYTSGDGGWWTAIVRECNAAGVAQPVTSANFPTFIDALEGVREAVLNGRPAVPPDMAKTSTLSIRNDLGAGLNFELEEARRNYRLRVRQYFEHMDLDWLHQEAKLSYDGTRQECCAVIADRWLHELMTPKEVT